MPWLADKILDGQHQRVDISAHTGAAHKGLLQKRLEEDPRRLVPCVPPGNTISQGTELN